MTIDLTPLKYSFQNKPVLVGGKAMEYYGLRKSGDDIDLIVTAGDLEGLTKLYPDKTKDIFGDHGVAVYGFEIWKTIRLFDYDFYKEGSKDIGNVLVISLEKLLFMKALAMNIPKYQADLKLIVDKINSEPNSILHSNKSIIK